MADWRDKAIELAPAQQAAPEAPVADWRNAAIPMETMQQSIAPSVETSALEALLRGGTQGLTFGFGDELAGGLGALGEYATTNKSLGDLMELYKKHRDESRAEYRAAEEAHPIASGIGNLGGAIVPALLTAGGSAAATGAAGLGRLAATGAASGALAGLGSSTAEDIGGMAKDVAVGGALGGALAPTIAKAAPIAKDIASGIGRATKALATTKPVTFATEAVRQGFKGRNLIGEGGQKLAEKMALETSEEVPRAIQSVANAAQAEKLALLKEAGEMGSQTYAPFVEQMETAVTEAAKRSGDSNDLATISDLIRRSFYDKVVDEAGNTQFVPKPAMDLLQFENFAKKLKAMGSSADGIKDPTAQALVNRLLSPLKDRPLNYAEELAGVSSDVMPLTTFMENLVPGLSKTNAQIHTAVEALGSVPKAEQLVPIGHRSLEGQKTFESLFKTLKSNPETEKLVPALEAQIKDASKVRGLAGKISESGLGSKSSMFGTDLLSETAKGTALALFNGLGQVGKFTVDQAKKATPEVLQEMANIAFSKTGDAVAGQLGRVLTEAAKRDDVGRNALLFSIQQNPSYRAALQRLAEDKNGPTE